MRIVDAMGKESYKHLNYSKGWRIKALLDEASERKKEIKSNCKKSFIIFTHQPNQNQKKGV